MPSIWGNYLKLSIFGESHGPGIGVVLDGLPAGVPIDREELERFTQRRAPGKNRNSTPRKENDWPEFLSGYWNGATTGTPLAALIRNHDTQSKDYSQMQAVARPGHADFTGFLRYAGANDVRGGGHFSGRLTAPLTLAGGIAKQVLARRGIVIGAHLVQVGGCADLLYDPANLDEETLLRPGNAPFPTLDERLGARMQRVIEQARMEQDSVGGMVECGVLGFPSGIGSPMFGGLENRIASLAFGIPAVKGVEFGDGFLACALRGSQNNDPFTLKDGQIVTETNHAGGILGGISTGMPILFRVGFKPTPSISLPQKTVNFREKRLETLEVHGRHDPCVAVRAVPVVEAAAALALLDALLEAQGYQGMQA